MPQISEKQRRKEQKEQEYLKKQQEIRNQEVKEQEEIKNKKRQKIESAYEFRYREIMKELLEMHTSFDEKMKNGIKLFALIGIFRKQAVKAVEEVVNDLIFPPAERKYCPQESWKVDQEEEGKNAGSPNILKIKRMKTMSLLENKQISEPAK